MKSVQYVRLSWLPLPLLFLAVCAQATELRDPSVSSNPGINNSSVRLDGKLFLDTNVSFSDCADVIELDTCLLVPWVINVFAGPVPPILEECLRLDLVAPAPQNINTRTDLQLVVIDQFGDVYANDNRSNSDFRPLVKIDNIQEEGWFTVYVQRAFDETGPVNFTLRYGRYNEGNPNCANPTQPLVSQEAAAMGLTGEQEAAAAREARRERRKAVRATSSSEVPEDTE